MEKSTWFEMTSEGERITRQAADPLNIRPRMARLEIRKNFTHRVIESWNKLPKDVKSAGTVDSFKNGLRKHRREMFAAS